MKLFILPVSLWVGFLAVAPPGTARSSNLDQDLLIYLPMTEDLRDHSAQNEAVKVSGKVELRDHAAYFAGKEDWLEVPHLALNDRPFAIAMWLKLTGPEPMYGLVEQHGGNTVNSWLHVMLRGERQPYLGFYVNDAIAPTSIAPAEWAHLVFQYVGGRQELWINGRLMCARTAPAYRGSRGETCIGKSPRWTNVPSKDFEGFMRELRIYGRALSANEVGQLVQITGERRPLKPDLASRPAAVPTRPPESVSNNLATNLAVPFLSIDGNKLVISGEAGQIYELHVTGDLNKAWQPLTTLTNANGQVVFIDTDAPNYAGRFYRIMLK